MAGGLRPIAIGRVWRKVWAKLCLARWRSRIADQVQPEQFGVDVPNGAATMAKALQQHAAEHPDIAISTVSRVFALECLNAIDPGVCQELTLLLSSAVQTGILAI